MLDFFEDLINTITDSSVSKKFLKGAVFVTLIFLIMVALFFRCTFRINPGFVGVVYNVDGGVEDKTLSQGWNIVLPWKSVTQYPVSTETVYYAKASDEKSADNSIYVNTKDGKQVNVDVTYAYHMNPENLPQLFTKFRGRQYLEIENSIMKNIMFQSINEVTSQYSLMELTGDKIPEINEKVFKKFREGLEVDTEGIVLETINLSNVRPDEETKQAIQSVINSQNALAKSKIEKEQAEVDAEKARIAAKGKADALFIEAEGQARANERLQETLTELIIKQRQLEKWDGKFPQFMSGGSESSFLFNITK